MPCMDGSVIPALVVAGVTTMDVLDRLPAQATTNGDRDLTVVPSG